jgi:hypothetical protein
MAGNIMATIPTTQTTRKEETTPRLGELNTLAIVDRGIPEPLVVAGREFCRTRIETSHPEREMATNGTPTESLKRSLEFEAFVCSDFLQRFMNIGRFLISVVTYCLVHGSGV